MFPEKQSKTPLELVPALPLINSSRVATTHNDRQAVLGFNLKRSVKLPDGTEVISSASRKRKGNLILTTWIISLITHLVSHTCFDPADYFHDLDEKITNGEAWDEILPYDPSQESRPVAKVPFFRPAFAEAESMITQKVIQREEEAQR
jgi:hypothetical protein